jgi:hypothetical protein
MNKIIVSEEFVKVFRNFNVVNQVEEIKKLDKKEIYLLLILCLDKFEPEDPVVKYNFQPFKEEVMEIYDVQDDKETSNQILKDLINETGDNYIETDNIVDVNGQPLPQILTKDEVRDEKIKIINNIENKN